MRNVQPRWDPKNRRWECSIGSGKTRKWFRCKIEGEAGRQIVQRKYDAYVHGPAPLKPGSLAEFIETVWWPRTKAKATKATLDGYRSILGRSISPFYGWLLQDLTLDVLQAWVTGMKKEPKTIHNEYRVMSSILELARLTGKYDRSDHKLVVLPEIGQRWAAEGLEPENIERILAVAKGTIWEGPIWAAAFLGLRRNEVCGLKKGHIKIDGETALITVQHNRQPGIETDKLKSKRKGESREISVPRALAEKLLSFGAHDGIYVFHGGDGKPIHPNKITRRMPELCAKAKVPIIDFKDLRAACRSNLSAAGVADVVIMAILGHSTFKTSKIYQDNRPSRQIEAFSRLVSKG